MGNNPEGPEAIDLGLPSHLKWASCNVGATSPEEFGDYFAWGEIKPKTTYDWSTYKWCCRDSYDSMTKYCTSPRYGTVDNTTILDPEDDAAHENWGGAWRMPTQAELDELCDECRWEWTTHDGVSGYCIKGPNGNSIFLPAAEYRGVGYVKDTIPIGYYWTSSLSMYFSDGAYSLNFIPDGKFGGSFLPRSSGRSIRPVCQ